jgi:replicative DNA helicase
MNQIPFNEEFEKALIVGILQDPSLLPKVTGIVTSDDFFKESHKKIMRVIEDMNIDNLDSLAVEDKLTDDSTRDHFKQLIRDSDSLLPSLSNVIFYAETIKDKSKLRAGIDLGRELAALCYQDSVSADEVMEQVESVFSNFLQKRVKDNLYESTKESFKQFIDKLGTRINDEGGIRTGFKAIDLILHRLEGLIILAARPSVGKTALAINIARNVAEEKPVVFFSLEQTQEQVFERMLAAEAEVSLEEIRTGAFIAEPRNTERIAAAKDRLIEVFNRFHVDERDGIQTSHIASVARQKKFEWGEIGLIVVDYLHIIRLNDKAKVDALGDATKELRALGKELGCPVLLLSQLSRQPEMTSNQGEEKKRRRPELTDLRSSGEIEQSADVVMFLHRDSYYEQSGYVPDEDEIEVIIKKHRNGRTGITSLVWIPKYIKYKDIT